MNYDENKYDVSVDPFELNKLSRLKQHDKIFVTPPNAALGVEGFQQLLPPMMKFGRIFRLRKDKVSYTQTGMLLRQTIGTALVPLVSSPTEIGHVTKLLFGSGLYKRMMYNYIFPRKTSFKNPYIPGSKKFVKMHQTDEYVALKKSLLPDLTQPPSYIIRNVKNSIFDFTDILKETLPNRAMCSRPAVMKSSDNIILQNILRLCFSDNVEGIPLFSTYTSTLPPVNQTFKNIIIPFKITSRDKRIANIWINPEFKLTSMVLKRDPEISSHLGILKFTLSLLAGDQFESNEIARRLADAIRKTDHCVFVFYNDTHAFYVDYKEFVEKHLRYDSMFRYIKTSLKLLISLNNSELTDEEIDELENKLLSESDDTNIQEQLVDDKINNASKFNQDMVDAVSEPANKLKPNKAVKIDFTGDNKNITDANKQFQKMMNPWQAKQSDKTSVQLLAEAQEKLNQKIKLGFTSTDQLLKQKQTPVAALMNDDAVNDMAKINTFVDRLHQFQEEDISDDDWDFGNDEDEDSETEDENEETPTTAEEPESNDSEDELDEESEDEEEDDTDDFMAEQKKKNESNATTAIINSIRETLEGKVSAKQQAYYDSIKNKYKSIKFNENETLEDVLKRANTVSIDTHDEKLDLLDESFNTSILTDFSKSYIKKTMAQDIVANIKAFSDENKSNQLAITKFEKEDLSDQFNKLERYKFELKDKYGKTHHINFKLPKIDDDGFMFLGGNTKMIKKQWLLKPVTKTSPDEVYVQSNYNKVRIYRVGKNINKNTVVIAKIANKISKTQTDWLNEIEIYRGNNTRLNVEYQTTIEYDELAAIYNKFIINPKSRTNKITYYFSQKEIAEKIKKDNLKFDFNSVRIPVGIKSDGTVISVDPILSTESVGKMILADMKESSNRLADEIDAATKTVKSNAKKIYSKIELQSKEIPLIIFLSGTFGFKKVLELENVKCVFVKKGEKISSETISPELLEIINKPDVNTHKFLDGTLYYDTYPIDQSMLLNGLCELPLETLEYADLDNLNTFIEYTYDKFKTRNLIKGWIAFKDLFIDPKTLEIIKELHLPTDLCELILYANSLLQNNTYQSSGEVSSWRIRDYEVLPDLLYNSISENYRKYMMKGKSREGFSIPEDDILNKLNKSFILVNYDTTSPGSEIREKSAVTFKGPNGINMDRAFTLDKRGQTVSNIGTVAISGPDNSNIGITRQLTANPRIINTYGFVEPTTAEEAKKLSSTSLYAMEECIPYGQCNDPKRIGFLSSQTKHLVPGLAFDVPMVGTGMERAMIYKTSSTFGYKAKMNGKIIKIDDAAKYILIKYNDGTTERVDYGAKYIKNSDFYLANNIEIDVKEGQSVKEGQVITHNKDYFKKHMGRLVYTQGAMARVAVHDGEVTEEDSSGMSWRVAKKLGTTVIKKKQLVLNPTANIVSCVKIGDHVTYGDPLISYEDAKDTDSDMALLDQLGDVDESILETIARHSASANYTGVIHDIKLYWTIDPDLMGESAKKFVKNYIKKIGEEVKAEEALTGAISKRRSEMQITKPLNTMKNRINGALVNPKTGSIVIEFFIEHVEDRHPGDKVALLPALKSVNHKVFKKEECPYRINAKSKFNTIDYYQSSIGILARMTVSQDLTGFLSKALFERGKEIAEEFLQEIK